MATLNEALRRLEQARDFLVRSSQEASGGREWARARRLVDLAEYTDRLRAEVEALRSDGDASDASEALSEGMPPRGERLAVPAGSGKARPAGYPRFWVRDDVLVKQGLQRDGRNVYEHAVPRERFENILERLAKLAHQRTKEFSIDDVQQALDCPVYMTYVVVSLLVREGLVRRARKGAYGFPAPDEFPAQAAGLWPKLQKPERN